MNSTARPNTSKLGLHFIDHRSHENIWKQQQRHVINSVSRCITLVAKPTFILFSSFLNQTPGFVQAPVPFPIQRVSLIILGQSGKIYWSSGRFYDLPLPGQTEGKGLLSMLWEEVFPLSHTHWIWMRNLAAVGSHMQLWIRWPEEKGHMKEWRERKNPVSLMTRLNQKTL